MLDVYESGAYFEGGEFGYVSYAQQERALRATYRRLVANLVRARLAGGELLEVGSGYGYLLEQAVPYFAACTGTEYSDAVATAARDRGLDVVHGGIESLPDGKVFDCVIAMHVVEHVYDPRGFVAALTDRLRPGGTLLLGTPDMASIWRRFMRARWPSFKIPEHVLYFDRSSLSNLLTDAGFEHVRPFPFRHAFPLALLGAKLGLHTIAQRAGDLGTIPVWLPATTVAVAGRRPAD